MGKNSLIKSTAPKKGKSGKAQTKTKAVKKPVRKTTKAVKAKSKPAASKADSAVTTRELIFKKFAPLQPQIKPQAPPPPKRIAATAPPFVAGDDPQTVARIRKLLFKHFSMADVNAAAASEQTSKDGAVKPASKPANAQAPAPQVAGAVKTDTKSPTGQEQPAGPPEPPLQKGADPVTQAMKLFIAATVLLILLIIAASHVNSKKFFIKPRNDAIEIWRGQFSPQGERFFLVLHGIQPPGPSQKIYSQEEIFPFIFNYYLGKADALLELGSLPDFEAIRGYLHKAEQYALSNQMHAAVNTRLTTIERMILLYKVDVAISKGTAQSLQAAMQYLKEAQRLSRDETQRAIIQQKMADLQERKAALEAKPAETSTVNKETQQTPPTP